MNLNWFERRDLKKVENEVWALMSRLVDMKETTKIYWCRNKYSTAGSLYALKMAIDGVLKYKEEKEEAKDIEKRKRSGARLD